MGDSMATPEQRRSPRIPVEVEVHVTPQSEHNFYTGYSQNISRGGIFIATSHVLPIGTELSFEFRLGSDPEPIAVEGVVRWVRGHDALRSADLPTGMGVQFHDVPGPARERINRFIEGSRESLFFDPD